MSYILDALRKADQERTIGDVPDLATSHWSQRRTGPVRSWVWLVIALLLVNGVLVTVLFLDNDEPPGRTVISSQITDPVQEIPPRQAIRPPQREIVAAPRKPAPAEPIQRTPRVVISTPQPRTPAASRPMDAQPAPAKRVRTLTTEIPEWNELPLDFRRDYDPPKLDVHVYNDDPARRFILVRLKRYKEGDSLNGAVLEKIQSDSIQLKYQGTRFRIDR